jgi:hypothetical protein
MKRRGPKIVRSFDQAQRPKASKPKRASVSNKAFPAHSSAAGEPNEVTRVTRERDEALAQQTATSEVLQVISRFPDDVQPVFSALLEKAVRICDATFGNIFRLDGNAFHLVATLNTRPAFAEARRKIQPHPVRMALLIAC